MITKFIADKLPPAMLPVALINPGVIKLPPAMFDVTFSAETTLPLKLNPTAFKLLPVMLPLALIVIASTFPATKLP